MDVAPFGVAVALLAPALLVDPHVVPARAPVGGIGRASLVVDGGVVQSAATGQVLGGDDQQGLRIVRIGPAVAVIDPDQRPAVVGIAVARVADIERLVAVAAVVVDPLAVGGVLDHPVFAAFGAPDPRGRALVGDRIVGRAVGEGVVQGIGRVDVAVDRTPRLRGARNGRGLWQLLRQRRGRLLRRRGGGERQAGDRGAGRRLGPGGFVAGAQAEGGKDQSGAGRGQQSHSLQHGATNPSKASPFPASDEEDRRSANMNGARTGRAALDEPFHRRNLLHV